MITEVLFYFFALIIVAPVIYILITKNVIRAVFALAFSFLGFAGLYILMHGEFMAVVQLLIYAGGIIVLMVFGLMLTKTTLDRGFLTTHRSLFSGLLIAILLFVSLAILAGRTTFFAEEAVADTDHISRIGIFYLTDFIVAFEVVAFLLLIALIGASYLAKRSGEE